jgi:hypothetical protein
MVSAALPALRWRPNHVQYACSVMIRVPDEDRYRLTPGSAPNVLREEERVDRLRLVQRLPRHVDQADPQYLKNDLVGLLVSPLLSDRHDHPIACRQTREGRAVVHGDERALRQLDEA